MMNRYPYGESVQYHNGHHWITGTVVGRRMWSGSEFLWLDLFDRHRVEVPASQVIPWNKDACEPPCQTPCEPKFQHGDRVWFYTLNQWWAGSVTGYTFHCGTCYYQLRSDDGGCGASLVADMIQRV